MTMQINGTSGLVFNDASTQNTAASGFGFKNRLINGDMRIDQRNAGASVATSSGFSVYSVDRWYGLYSQTSKFTMQQNAGSVTPPNGFRNYLGCTSTSAYTVGSGEIFDIRQAIEGFNVADLMWGTANAAPITISFWVRSSLTGTFGGALQNSGATRSYPFSYTISAANTWEQKSITVAGDTTGTWLTNNGVGLLVAFTLGVGSSNSGTAGSWQSANLSSATGATSVVGTNGATFYITGVQLEKGFTATSFDYRPYGTELALCQRYAIRYCGEGTFNAVGNGYAFNTTTVSMNIPHLVQMRTQASITVSGNYVLNGNGGTPTANTFSVDTNVSSTKMTFVNISATGLGQGAGYTLIANNSTANSFLLSAEL